jgi:hypothetical protein
MISVIPENFREFRFLFLKSLRLISVGGILKHYVITYKTDLRTLLL